MAFVNTIPAVLGPNSIAGNIIRPDNFGTDSPFIQYGATMANAAAQEIV